MTPINTPSIVKIIVSDVVVFVAALSVVSSALVVTDDPASVVWIGLCVVIGVGEFVVSEVSVDVGEFVSVVTGEVVVKVSVGTTGVSVVVNKLSVVVAAFVESRRTMIALEGR